METRCHAARLFFNLAYLKQNRAQFIAKGGLKHIEHLAFHTEGDTSTGTAQKLVLSLVFVWAAGVARRWQRGS